ncbi:MAG: hypothetical protein ACR2ON_05460 [Paracoccaceae bacterium]
MANKVTGKVLRELILEILTESSSVKFQVAYSKDDEEYFLEISGLTPEQEGEESKVLALAKAAGVPDKLVFDRYYSASDPEYGFPASFALGNIKPTVAVGTVYSTDGKPDDPAPAPEKEADPEPEKEADPELIALSDATKNKGLSNDSTQAEFQKVLSKITDTMEKGTIDTLKDIFNAIVEDFKALFSSDPSAEQDAFDAKEVELSKPAPTAITYDFKDSSTAVKDALKATFGANISNTILSKIAGLKESVLNEDTSKFEIEDIEALMQKAIDHPKTNTALKGKKKKDANDKRVVTGKDNVDIATLVDAELKKFINKVKDPAMARKLTKAKIDYDKALQSSRGLNPEIDTTFATSGRMATPATVGGSKRAPVDPVVFKSFDMFFTGTTDFKSRLDRLSKFSIAIEEAADGNPANLNNFPAEQIITGGNVMSMVSKLTRQMDPSAGGYFAEAFLAYLVGGAKTGQTGGAGDFQGPNGKNYSSKWGETSKSQAVSNFMTKGAIVTYITAGKVLEKGSPGSTESMTVLELELKIYDIYIQAAPTHDKNYKVKNPGAIRVGGVGKVTSAKQGKKREGPKNKGDQLAKRKNPSFGSYEVDPPSSASSYVVKLTTGSDEVFDQIFSKAVSRISDQVARAAARFNALSRQLEENTTNYSVSSDFTEAVQMADTYAEIKNELATIYTGKTGESDATRIGLAEQKITASFLKKLISESFKR